MAFIPQYYYYYFTRSYHIIKQNIFAYRHKPVLFYMLQKGRLQHIRSRIFKEPWGGANHSDYLHCKTGRLCYNIIEPVMLV